MSTLNATNLKNPSSGSNNIVLGTDGSTTIPTLSATTITGTSVRGGITSSAVNAGGTNPFPSSGGPPSVDFTGIPSWVKRVTVMFNGVSTSGTSNLQIQIGSGSVATTGYDSASYSANSVNVGATTGFLVTALNFAAGIYSGATSLFLQNSSTNSWVASGTLGQTTVPASNGSLSTCGGNKALSGTLDRIRVTTVNGTDTFDAGSINILMEG